MNPLLDAALAYAADDWKVIPLHSPVAGGGCSCRRADCSSPAKHPRTAHGLRDATDECAVIERWWSQWPVANIGVLTGTGSVILVLDIDPRHGGDDALATMIAKHGELPETVTAETGGGGTHYFFRHPGRSVPSRTGIVRGIDCKADGGYVVAAPSIHASGTPYLWAHGLGPDDVPLTHPPDWLLTLILPDVRRNGERPRKSQSVGGVIADGSRNETLTSLAGTMRRREMTPEEIDAALQAVNTNRCCPPLPADEVANIARSVGRYEPAEPEHHGCGPVVIRMEDIEPCELEWLWPNRIPAGRITLLVGRPGEGKSVLTCDIAARISVGAAWPDDALCPPGSVLFITSEDDPGDTVRPRLDAAGADCRNVHLLAMVRRVDDEGREFERMFSLADLQDLETTLQQLPDCKWVVIDPIGSFLGGGIDAHRDNEVRSLLAPLAKLAEKYGPAMLVIAHRRKSSAAVADDLALGSRAFTGIARAVWHLTRDPNDKMRRLLLPGKMNLAPEGSGLAFAIEGLTTPRIAWEAEAVTLSADDLAAAECQRGKRGPDADKLDAAVDFLRNALADGPRKTKELTEEAREGYGISKRTLERAREALHVEPFRPSNPGPWWLRLPEHSATGCEPDPKHEQPGDLGDVPESSAETARMQL